MSHSGFWNHWRSTKSPEPLRPPPNPVGVQINDIYQAAMKRAVEDYEIDKLFNPEPNDFQI